MTISNSSKRFRVSAAAAIATIGLFGLSACSSGEPQAEEKPSTNSSAPAETETKEEAPASGQTKCSAEQFSTLSSAGGVALPAEAHAAASASFAPDAVVGDLPTVCVLSFESAAGTGSYAVLPGGAATLTAVAANATAAGAEVTEAAGTLTGSVEGLTILGLGLTQLTQETAGFENVEDLVVVIATGLAG